MEKNIYSFILHGVILFLRLFKPHPLPAQNFLMVEIPTPKPYIFMIGVTRRIKCIVVHNPGVNPHPLPAQNFLTVEIPTPKPYIFMIGVTRRIKCIVVHTKIKSYKVDHTKSTYKVFLYVDFVLSTIRL